MDLKFASRIYILLIILLYILLLYIIYIYYIYIYARDNKKMRQKQTRSKIVKKLDAIFSQYIRMRYAKDGIAECVTCGKKDHWKRLQAGHFMSRKHYATRWDEDNVQVQCAGCNIFRVGEQYKFSLYLGQEKADELYARSQTIQKFSTFELEELIQIYQQKVAELSN